MRVGITGKYVAMRDAYASLDKAIEHCSAHLGTAVELEWIETTAIDGGNAAAALEGLDGVIVPGGFGARGVEGKIWCVKHCRERGLPYLGICLGFQVGVIEFARNVLGLADANSTEFKPGSAAPVISELPEQKRIEGLGATMRLGGQEVAVGEGTLAEFLYRGRGRGSASGPLMVRERFRHRYEVDPEFVGRLEAGGLIFSGRHPRQPIMQILELAQPGDGGGGGPATPTHPYFIAAQFHPELVSRPMRPHPLYMGLIAAAIQRKYGGAAGKVDPAVEKWVRGARGAAQAV